MLGGFIGFIVGTIMGVILTCLCKVENKYEGDLNE